jgi:hypothetical protein
MPFHPPWRTYEPGDLIYGLRANREELASHLGVQGAYTIAPDVEMKAGGAG